jgi:hypothetical protein
MANFQADPQGENCYIGAISRVAYLSAGGIMRTAAAGGHSTAGRICYGRLCHAVQRDTGGNETSSSAPQ